MYKYSEERTASEPSLYTDDSHPWMGAVVDYVQEIVAFSRTVNTPGSPRVRYPSPFPPKRHPASS